MKKIYKIIIFFFIFIFLTTYIPREIDVSKKNVDFFQIKKIKIINNNLIKNEIINKKINKFYNKNIFFIKKKDIEKSLNSLNFLKSIEVKKKFPETIILKIYETEPVALIFKKNQKYILDSSSNLIPFTKDISIENLPNIFGEEAEKEFLIFLKILENKNFPTNLIKNFYFFQIGRWDVQFYDNKIIKFPSSKTAEAIELIVELLDRKDFKNYNVIDLRVHDKIVVE